MDKEERRKQMIKTAILFINKCNNHYNRSRLGYFSSPCSIIICGYLYNCYKNADLLEKNDIPELDNILNMMNYGK